MNRGAALLVIFTIVFGGCAAGVTPAADGYNPATYSQQKEERATGGGGRGGGGY
jgi:hypothetical protein